MNTVNSIKTIRVVKRPAFIRNVDDLDISVSINIHDKRVWASLGPRERELVEAYLDVFIRTYTRSVTEAAVWLVEREELI